jgi:hypothetical protein
MCETGRSESQRFDKMVGCLYWWGTWEDTNAYLCSKVSIGIKEELTFEFS